MAMKIARSKTLPIGVDLGTTAAKLAQLRMTGEDVELVAAGMVKVPLTVRKDVCKQLDCLGAELQSLVKSSGFKGSTCILSLPAESTFVHHVRIPNVSPSEVAGAVAAELGGKLPYAVSEAVVRHVVAGEIYGDGETRREVLTVSAPRATLESYLAMARRAKLDVAGVNVESCAIVECFSRLFRRGADAERTILYVDMGCVSTQVALSHRSKIVFARNLAMGGERFDRTVADLKGVTIEQGNAVRRELQDDEDQGDQVNQVNLAAQDELYQCLDEPIRELADGLTQCLRYYESVFPNQSVERAIFVGGQAYDKRLCQTIAQRLNVPAQIGDPLTRVKWSCPPGPDIVLDRRIPQPEWAVAIGLSLGAATAA